MSESAVQEFVLKQKQVDAIKVTPDNRSEVLSLLAEGQNEFKVEDSRIWIRSDNGESWVLADGWLIWDEKGDVDALSVPTFNDRYEPA